MPIYEYECSQCHQVSDALQKVNDPPPETCPRCGAQRTLSRLLSRTSFVLKGGGWYADLYSSNKSKPSDGGDSKPAAKTEGASSGAEAPSAPSTSSDGGSSSGSGGSSGPGTSGSGPVNSAPKVAAAKA
jgi:putative FmdB family regulatory protein